MFAIVLLLLLAAVNVVVEADVTMAASRLL
jgi:hypothetical protein